MEIGRGEVLELCSLESLRSSEIEPAGSIARAQMHRAWRTATRGEAAWYTLPQGLLHRVLLYTTMRQPKAKAASTLQSILLLLLRDSSCSHIIEWRDIGRE